MHGEGEASSNSLCAGLQWPEVPELVEEARRRIKRHAAGIRSELEDFFGELTGRNLTALKGPGWPLRPFFVDRTRLEHISSTLTQRMLRFRDQQLATDGAAFAQLPVPASYPQTVRWREAFTDPDFGLWLRPDGFLDDERFQLTEPAFGNGWIVSVGYCDLLFEYFERSRHWQDFPVDLSKQPRPFDVALDAIELRLDVEPHDGPPLVALLAHHWEHGVLLSWPERVMQLVALFQKRLGARGVECTLLNEDDIEVDDHHVCRRRRDGRRIDMVVMLTIGSSFIEDETRLAGELQHLCGPMVGHAPFLQPIAHTLIAKGSLPALYDPALDAIDDGGRRPDQATPSVVVAESIVPDEANGRMLRLEREGWVLKRALGDKDTHIGKTTPHRLWVRVLDEAIEHGGYVAQRALELPRAQMPMLLDAGVEWIEVQGELSTFIVEGKFAGAFSRYAPAAEGLVLSPPPEDMGFTLVLGV